MGSLPVPDALRWWWQVSNRRDEYARAVLTLSLVVLSISWYAWLTRKSRKADLPLPPGPRGLPLVGNLLSLHPELHVYFAELARTYGPITKLQLGKKLGIVITSPSLAKEVLKDHDTTFANRDVPAAGRAATYGGLDIVWTPYGPEWRLLRKVCVREMLGTATLDAVYGLRQREVRRTVEYLYSRTGSQVNIGEQMFLTVLNLITSMLWGDTIKGEERSRLGAEFRQAIGEMTALLGMPNVSEFFPILARFDLQGVERKMKVLASQFDRMFDSMIHKRLNIMDEKGREESHDFLQFLLNLKDQGDAKNSLTMNQVKALLMDMVIGGTDTTSNTVEWAIAELMNKPETMRKAQEELERVVGKDNIVEESHLPKLHYLQAVMKEVLRLHPALPLFIPHCPSSSCAVGGYMVPKGARVFVNAWAIHRDPVLWDKPLTFDPERFLIDGKWDYTGKDLSYIPFGSGRRICAGMAMAERMVMYALASLLHSFDWELPEGAKLQLTEKFGIVLKKATPLVAVPTPRLSDPKLYAGC
ncbi:PREDICTED: flavonoid 3'-monooxygenase-like [Nelumbo nucifera]|uniref:Flavonoid 3'-monooxygenase-like n=1 Tax=Nelumbo nucifera TaxID=4432 RepID=A0A1U8B799_NELNU|nr:PREDICTED: flavonoid 3'-monooxygenase-like [Nelumbo nucifera]XP_010276901.1 PREDICTED: flavonoid 3'-monooxygenase-like [Nelumbo nucifera]